MLFSWEPITSRALIGRRRLPVYKHQRLIWDQRDVTCLRHTKQQLIGNWMILESPAEFSSVFDSRPQDRVFLQHRTHRCVWGILMHTHTHTHTQSKRSSLDFIRWSIWHILDAAGFLICLGLSQKRLRGSEAHQWV